MGQYTLKICLTVYALPYRKKAYWYWTVSVGLKGEKKGGTYRLAAPPRFVGPGGRDPVPWRKFKLVASATMTGGKCPSVGCPVTRQRTWTFKVTKG